MLFRSQACLQAGERVLVHAVGSGVGTAAVQLARAAGAGAVYGTARNLEKIERARGVGLEGGAGAVYGTARNLEKIERAREFGLDEGVAVGDEARAFAEAVRAWTKGAGVN